MAASLFKWLAVYVYIFLYHPPDMADHERFRHPLYVTVTEISQNAKDKTLEISCKIFTNDFEGALEKAFQTKADLSDAKDKPHTDKMVNDYIAKHLQLKVDGKPLTLQFVGSEKETDATWSYFQVSGVSSVKKLEVMNNLLYESFSNEINIMHVTVGDNRKSGKVNNPDANAVFEF